VLEVILVDQTELPRKRRFDVHFSYRAALKDWRTLALLALIEQGNEPAWLLSYLQEPHHE
jgi:hypothetical protein